MNSLYHELNIIFRTLLSSFKPNKCILSLLLATYACARVDAAMAPNAPAQQQGVLYEVGKIPENVNMDALLHDPQFKNKITQKLCNLYSRTKTDLPVLLFLGATGSGKTTSIAALLGLEMYKNDYGDIDIREDQRGRSYFSWFKDSLIKAYSYMAEVETPEERIKRLNQLAKELKVGHTKNVCMTTESHVYPLEEHKIAFCDTEGFLGVRKLELDDLFISFFEPSFVIKSNKLKGLVVVMRSSYLDQMTRTDLDRGIQK